MAKITSRSNLSPDKSKPKKSVKQIKKPKATVQKGQISKRRPGTSRQTVKAAEKKNVVSKQVINITLETVTKNASNKQTSKTTKNAPKSSKQSPKQAPKKRLPKGKLVTKK